MNGETSCLHEADEFESCGLFVRPMMIKEFFTNDLQNKIDGHEHFFDHLMVCITGSAHIIGRYPDGTLAFEDDINQGDVFPVQKNIEHEIIPTAVPYKHLCIFPSRLPNGKVAGENTGWRMASMEKFRLAKNSAV